ncbi:hypothetical protein L7F22_023909 [Adiantum nelumboides]|nr:hypothetical protein [Adiantum nelumboides]
MRKRQRRRTCERGRGDGMDQRSSRRGPQRALARSQRICHNNNSGGKVPAEQKDKLALQHRKLSEFLLRALLTLDGIAVNTDETRKHRKAAVKEVQGHLDQVDEAWQHFKEASKGSVGENSIKS